MIRYFIKSFLLKNMHIENIFWKTVKIMLLPCDEERFVEVVEDINDDVVVGG